MPGIAQVGQFTSAQFTQSDILKFIQLAGSRILWAEVEGLDVIFNKKGKYPGGKQVTYHLTADPGGAAFGGINANNAASPGVFVPNDPAKGIQGYLMPKYQTMTTYYERFMDELSKTEAQAFINSAKLEMEQKTRLQRSMYNVQKLGDGSGRLATVTAIGTNEIGASTGAASITDTLTNAGTLLKIKLSNSDTAVGSVAHLCEGMVVSIMYPEYDSATTGTAALTRATCIPRLLALEFKGTGGSYHSYDAFRVVKVDQDNNAIYVSPARRASAASGSAYTAASPYSTWTADQHVQNLGSTSLWCDGTSTVTWVAYRGRTNTFAAATVLTAVHANSVFVPTALTSAAGTEVLACYLVHPGYIPSGAVSWANQNSDFSTYTSSSYLMTNDSYDAARRMLGIGWDTTIDAAASLSGIDASLVNPYIPTGIETLLTNVSNLVHGIPRSQVQQLVATSVDRGGKPLNFNTFLAALTTHFNRNREIASEFTMCMMNPIVYSSLVSLSELDRRIIEGKGVRGEDGAQFIKFGNKKYQLEMSTVVPTSRIYCIPQGAVDMYGGDLQDVKIGNQSEFMALNSSGRRQNAVEKYMTCQSEMCCEVPRQSMIIRNFTVNTI
jgi:hypothetical protein